MSHERTIELAENFVRQVEDCFVKTLRQEMKAPVKSKPSDKRIIQKILKIENERLNPKGKWDEEEQALGNLARMDAEAKKKKK